MIPYAVALWLFVVGLYGIVTSRHLVHLSVCVGVVQSATYVLLLAVGFRTRAAAPYFSEAAPGADGVVDPVVQAAVLTDIVVGAAVTALLISLALEVHQRTGSVDPEKLLDARD